MEKVSDKYQIDLEPHSPNHISKLNWLRASVLGANDGIVSIAGLVLGVAGATTSQSLILTAGVAGIIAGAISMAAGEYVSVSSSRDTEKALLRKEHYELKNHPEQELEELVGIYRSKGLSEKTARTVAVELTKRDAFAAHVDAELGIDPHNLTNPWHAAIASALSFLAGAIIPLVAIILPPEPLRIPFAFISVILALILAGILSAKVGGAHIKTAVVRIVFGGALAMIVTYGIGKFFGVAGI
ncbi:MAG: VIT family protein [Candidatus Levybacteria bacterium]|nr:VIT family protein [Candidatus Levybacteria bacterium]